MNKRILAFAASLVLFSGFAFGEDIMQNGMLVKAPGSLNMTIGAGDGVTAALEYPIGHFNAGDLVFSYGAKGFVWIPYAFNGVNVGAAGTIHFAWGCLPWFKDNAFARHIETFAGVGFTFGIYKDPGNWLDYSGNNWAADYDNYNDYHGLHLATYGGSSYFFNRTWAVTAAGGVGGSYIGVLWKIL
jgi:hypothetical protein